MGKTGDLAAVAAHHREAAGRDRLRAAIAGPLLRAPGGWVGQALERDCVLRLPELDPVALLEAGLPPDEARIGDVIIVPLAPVGAVIVTIRDRDRPPFSFAERLALERIAGDAIESLKSSPQLGRVSPEAERPDDPGAEHAPGPAEHGRIPHLLDLTTAGLWLIGRDGTTIWVNEAASELVGIPARELLGARVPEFIAGAEGAFGADLHAEERIDRKLIRPDGAEIWLSSVARPIFDQHGRPTGTLLTLFEISERKRRETELRMRLEAKQALAGLVELSLDAPNLKAILAESVAMLAEQLDAALTSVSAIDLERRELWVLVAAGQEEAAWARELESRGAIRISDQSLALAAIEQAQPVVIGDFDDDPGIEPSPQLTAHGIRSAACVPLSDGTSVLAALSRQPQGLGPSALPMLESVARLIANYRALVGELTRHGCAAASGGPLTRGSLPDGCERAPAQRARRPRRPGTL